MYNNKQFIHKMNSDYTEHNTEYCTYEYVIGISKMKFNFKMQFKDATCTGQRYTSIHTFFKYI